MKKEVEFVKKIFLFVFLFISKAHTKRHIIACCTLSTAGIRYHTTATDRLELS